MMEDNKRKKKKKVQASVRHVLSNPFQLHWPKVDERVAEKIFGLLKSSFADIKLQSKVKSSEQQEIGTPGGQGRKRLGKRRKGNRLSKETGNTEKYRKVTTAEGDHSEIFSECKEECLANAKVSSVKAPEVCLNNNDEPTAANKSSLDECTQDEESTPKNGKTALPPSDGKTNAALLQESGTKIDQFVVGLNKFTRCLERNTLRAGMVCLTARPALVTQHVLMLSATRECPVMALPNLSGVLAPLLGIKSALAVGFKKLAGADEDHFKDLVTLLVTTTPVPTLPWLSSVCPSPTEPSNGEGSKHNATAANYLPLKIKALTAQ